MQQSKQLLRSLTRHVGGTRLNLVPEKRSNPSEKPSANMRNSKNNSLPVAENIMVRFSRDNPFATRCNARLALAPAGGRPCFIWTNERPKDVEIVDYH